MEGALTPLHLAASAGQLDTIQRLFNRHHAALNPRSELGKTPLMHAANQHSISVLGLLTLGANHHLVDNKQSHFLHILASNRHIESTQCRQIIERCRPNRGLCDSQHATPLHAAAMANNLLYGGLAGLLSNLPSSNARYSR